MELRRRSRTHNLQEIIMVMRCEMKAGVLQGKSWKKTGEQKFHGPSSISRMK